MSLEKVQYSLSVEKEAVENDVKHLKGQIESIRSEMDGLKVYLYQHAFTGSFNNSQIHKIW